jgi:hypothetical protein
VSVVCKNHNNVAAVATVAVVVVIVIAVVVVVVIDTHERTENGISCIGSRREKENEGDSESPAGSPDKYDRRGRSVE